jgi:hypothetical protein
VGQFLAVAGLLTAPLCGQVDPPYVVTALYPPSATIVAMDAPAFPTISSFVIRFVVESTRDAYRGEIRHIQTNEEIHFNSWQDAVEFIQRYVPLAENESKRSAPPKT